MKSRKLKAKAPGEFHPFSIELVIETEEDLYDLWARLNLSPDTVRENNSSDVPVPDGYTSVSLWDVVNNEIETLGYYNGYKDE